MKSDRLLTYVISMVLVVVLCGVWVGQQWDVSGVHHGNCPSLEKSDSYDTDMDDVKHAHPDFPSVLTGVCQVPPPVTVSTGHGPVLGDLNPPLLDIAVLLPSRASPFSSPV